MAKLNLSVGASILLTVSVGLIGCTGATPLVEKAGASTTTGTGAPGTTSGDPPQSTTTGSTTVGTTGTVPVTTKPGFHAQRNYQIYDLESVSCSVNGHPFKLWVMDTPEKQQEGMMFLNKGDFKDDQGMVFVFPVEKIQRFWMRDTLVDLDVFYCGKDGVINSIYTMKSLDETTDYSSKKPSIYVIELRDGTAKRLGITPGMKFNIPSTVVAKG